MFAPSGRIVRRMHLVTEDEGVKLRTSGAGIIVYVHRNSRSRRTFARLLEALEIAAEPVRGAENASADGTYNRRTGEVEHDDTGIPHVFQCVGTVDALRELSEHPCVERCEFAVGVRVPVSACGTGSVTPAVKERLRGTRDSRHWHELRKAQNRVPESSEKSVHHDDAQRVAEERAEHALRLAGVRPEDNPQLVVKMARFILKRGRLPNTPEELVGY